MKEGQGRSSNLATRSKLGEVKRVGGELREEGSGRANEVFQEEKEKEGCPTLF